MGSIIFIQKQRQRHDAVMKKVHFAISIFPFTPKMDNFEGKHTLASIVKIVLKTTLVNFVNFVLDV